MLADLDKLLNTTFAFFIRSKQVLSGNLVTKIAILYHKCILQFDARLTLAKTSGYPKEREKPVHWYYNQRKTDPCTNWKKKHFNVRRRVCVFIKKMFSCCWITKLYIIWLDTVYRTPRWAPHAPACTTPEMYQSCQLCSDVDMYRQPLQRHPVGEDVIIRLWVLDWPSAHRWLWCRQALGS